MRMQGPYETRQKSNLYHNIMILQATQGEVKQLFIIGATHQ